MLFLLSKTAIGGDSSGLSLWEVGGMYFSMPYAKHTIEVDINGWYESDEPGLSPYGSYAFTDDFTMKVEVPFAFSKPVMKSFRITGLFGKQWGKSDAVLSGDLSLESYTGESARIIPNMGVNGALRKGIFAFLGRVSGGTDIYFNAGKKSALRIESEIAPFIYTGRIGMVGVPVIYEYTYGKSTLNVGVDLELYLPVNISLYVVPRYEALTSRDLSLWFGLTWMRIP